MSHAGRPYCRSLLAVVILFIFFIIFMFVSIKVGIEREAREGSVGHGRRPEICRRAWGHLFTAEGWRRNGGRGLHGMGRACGAVAT